MGARLNDTNNCQDRYYTSRLEVSYHCSYLLELDGVACLEEVDIKGKFDLAVAQMTMKSFSKTFAFNTLKTSPLDLLEDNSDIFVVDVQC